MLFAGNGKAGDIVDNFGSGQTNKIATCGANISHTIVSPRVPMSVLMETSGCE